MGRGIEMDVVAAFPDSLEEDPATFGVVGRAGIGKTTLWQAAIATACRCGHLAISSRPKANRPARSMRPEGNQDRASSALATTLRECQLLAAHNIPSSPHTDPSHIAGPEADVLDDRRAAHTASEWTPHVAESVAIAVKLVVRSASGVVAIRER